ncbi:MAG: haloacid dehalogenase type II [Gammaproteobacteria bacterium]|nr:haloacid dehalogenase type II [Gammaproteobacteria bacterium]
MNTIDINRFEVLTFDCYGTLIDWETGIWDALQPLLMDNGAGHVDRRAGLGAFADIENALEEETPDMPYPELLRITHRGIAERFGLRTTDALDRAFGESTGHWPAFGDTADALRLLKRHYRLVILSNVDRDGFAASNRKLGVGFDAIYTAEDIGSYKPDPRNFEYMLTRLSEDLGIGKEGILHTAQSLHHDHRQARAFGLANAWIDRQHLRDSDNWGATARVETRPDYDFYFNTMVEMADHVERGAPR